MRLFSRLTLATATLAALMAMPGIAHAKERILTNCFWPPQHYMCTKVLADLGQVG